MALDDVLPQGALGGEALGAGAHGARVHQPLPGLAGGAPAPRGAGSRSVLLQVHVQARLGRKLGAAAWKTSSDDARLEKCSPSKRNKCDVS